MKYKLMGAVAVLAAIVLSGCGQHYVVTKVESVNVPMRAEVSALSGRLNGYSLKLTNASDKPIAVDWSKVEFIQDDGFQVPMVAEPVAKGHIATIQPGASVEYHLERAHAYRPLHRQGVSEASLWWDDQLEVWKGEKGTLLLKFRFANKICKKKCRDWKSGRIIVKQSSARGPKPQERQAWTREGRLYNRPDERIGTDLSILFGSSTFSSYEPLTGGYFGIEAKQHIVPWLRAGVFFRFSSYGQVEAEQPTRGDLSASVTSTGGVVEFSRQLHSIFRLSLASLVVVDNAVMVVSNAVEPQLTGDWTQTDLYLGTRLRLEAHFPKSVYGFLGFEYDIHLAELARFENDLSDIWTAGDVKPAIANTVFGIGYLF